MPQGTTVTQDLTTRDIFQQLDTRVTRVEDDLRAFRAEVIARFERVEEELRAFRAEVNTRFDQIQWRLVSLVVVTWITIIASIWLKP